MNEYYKAVCCILFSQLMRVLFFSHIWLLIITRQNYFLLWVFALYTVTYTYGSLVTSGCWCICKGGYDQIWKTFRSGKIFIELGLAISCIMTQLTLTFSWLPNFRFIGILVRMYYYMLFFFDFASLIAMIVLYSVLFYDVNSFEYIGLVTIIFWKCMFEVYFKKQKLYLI